MLTKEGGGVGGAQHCGQNLSFAISETADPTSPEQDVASAMMRLSNRHEGNLFYLKHKFNNIWRINQSCNVQLLCIFNYLQFIFP